MSQMLDFVKLSLQLFFFCFLELKIKLNIELTSVCLYDPLIVQHVYPKIQLHISGQLLDFFTVLVYEF